MASKERKDSMSETMCQEKSMGEQKDYVKDSGRQKDRQSWDRKEWASLVEKHHRHMKTCPWRVAQVGSMTKCNCHVTTEIVRLQHNNTVSQVPKKFESYASFNHYLNDDLST